MKGEEVGEDGVGVGRGRGSSLLPNEYCLKVRREEGAWTAH